ncbi:PAS domain-containing hybrid sensor histidine kinase/response regulator [Rhodoferax sp.]|uniref:hybrid sensor histidine kinase/response regulator n=1 Tax=Rhodoferax sp. TaxID=50421 RepID=UPI00271B7AD7|nr:PAS domain-containing hybrid sensor histidine kinase/response regulator [Rhodoferax sp.]MDO9143430.1 ATP-binding protein [Rhodoferax sp.]MDP3863540.1 ATP-binding protein [Rhodoferax sp.]
MTHGPLTTEQLMHDLQVHQVELQSQNEELRRAQLALELSHARYFDLYDLAPVGYLTVAASGLIVEANLRAATLLGIPRSVLVKLPLSRFIVKTNQDSYYQCRRQLLETGQAQSCELQVLQNDGVMLWVRVIVSAVQDGTDAPALRVILMDISERKRLDEALRETNKNLELARVQADRANLAKSEFLSSMSHELRSPLNAILGFAQLMESGTPPPTPSQQASLDQILKGGWYLLDLINDILDLASIESGHAALTMEAVALNAVLLDCQTLIEPLTTDRGVHISFPELPDTCRVQADPTRLKQVLINLLSNAIKYNQLGGSVVVSCESPAAGRLRIGVRDSGPGLSKQKLAQLFQPFNRLGQEMGGTKGTGIGLVVSQRLVQSMGGEMGVDSREGEGSLFWFELTHVDAESAEVGPAVRATQPVPVHVPVLALPLTNSVQRTVLYIEDNPDNIALMSQLLAARPNLRLVGASDAMRGMAMARGLAPDVVVMDINLPDINGFEVLQLLQSDPVTRHIPVLALSANAMPHDLEKGLAAGFYRYVTKPIKVADFLHALDEGLALAEKRA